MQKIDGFFGKFKNRATAQIHNLAVISDIIKKYTGAEVELKNITISGGIVKIKAPLVVKSEIFIRKELLLVEIRKKIIHKIVDIQ